MHYIGIIGLIATGIGILLLAVQIIGTGCYINKDNKEKYRIISLKATAIRTSDEKMFINDNWFKYYVTKVRNISFMIGLPLLALTLLFNYITK
jgi:hypothetical protein